MNCYAGRTVTYLLDSSLKFASGAGFIMSFDVCRNLIQNRSYAENIKIIDDVDIGYTMKKLNIPLINLPRCDIYPGELSVRNRSLEYANSLIVNINNIKVDKYFHYRLKHFDPNKRQDEIIIMKKLLKKVYCICID
jgi:hypothetical protein